MDVYKLHIYSKQDRTNYSIISVRLKIQYTRSIFITNKENLGCWVIPEKSQRQLSFKFLFDYTHLSSHESEILVDRLLLESSRSNTSPPPR